jgi:hypothetical protein
MRTLLSILLCVLLLALAGPVGAATYTVGPVGCDYTNLDAAVSKATTGDTVNVVTAGSYTCTENIDGKSGLTVQNTSGGTVTVKKDGAGTYVFYSTNGTTNNVTVSGFVFDGDGTAGRIFYTTGAIDGWTLQNSTLREIGGNQGLQLTAAATNLTITGCTIISASSVKTPISITGGGSVTITNLTCYGDDAVGPSGFLTLDTSATTSLTATISRSWFEGGIGQYTVYARNSGGAGRTSTVTISACVFKDYEDGTNRYLARGGLFRDAGTTVNIYNCDFFNLSSFAFVLYDGLALNATNCIFLATGQTTSADLVSISSGSPTVNLTTCYQNLNAFTSSTENNATTNVSPMYVTDNDDMNLRFTAYDKPHGYIVLTMDDIEGHTAYQKSVVDVWQAKGVKGTLFVNPGSEGVDGIDLSGDADWKSLIGAGYDTAREWGVHSWSHAGLDKTTAFTIKMKTGDTATLDITETLFTLNCSNDAGDASFDLTNESYDSLYNVYTALAAAPYSTYYTIASYVDATNNRIQSSSMATVTGQAVPASGAAAYSILLDTGAPNYRYYRDELEDTKAWLVANTNAEAADIVAMAAPGSQTNAATVAYLLATASDSDVGLVFNRGGAAAGYTPAGNQHNLRSINMLLVQLCSTQYAFGPTTGGSRTEAEVTSHATALATWLRETGSVAVVYCHGPTEDVGANIITAEEWGWFIDAVQSVHPTMIKSAGEFGAIVRDSGTWTQNGVTGEVWNTTFTAEGNYHLRTGSPCINAGTDLGDTYKLDYDGINQDSFGDAWEIGAYVFDTMPTAATTPSPADGAVDVLVDATLSWANGGDTDSYDVYLSLDAAIEAGDLVSDDQAGTSYDPAVDLAAGIVYYWRIDSNNAAGTTTGTAWSFTTKAAGYRSRYGGAEYRNLRDRYQ